MSNILKYKKLLSGSTTMPYGATQGGAGSPMMTGGRLHGTSAHGSGCSCCGPAGDEFEDDDDT